MIAWATIQSTDRRFFHKNVALLCLVMSMTYFTMASNLGWVGVPVEFQRSSDKVSGATRQIFWVRYIGWYVLKALQESQSTDLYAGLSHSHWSSRTSTLLRGCPGRLSVMLPCSPGSSSLDVFSGR